MLFCLLMLVVTFMLGPLGWVAVVVVAALIAYEHRLVRAGDLSRIDAAFFTMNGWVSVLFFVFVTADVLVLWNPV
jgi:4-hydroxybenzoate polyprenyltransferase